MPIREHAGEDAEAHTSSASIEYSHRMHNPSLARLSIPQLRQKLEYYGLESGTLSYKWEYIDRMERYRRAHGFGILKKTNPNERSTTQRTGFTSLPAELRNVIYEMVLISPVPITIHYHENGSTMHVPKYLWRRPYGYRLRSIPHPGREQIGNFEALSLVHPQVSTEVRSFFYANNKINFCSIPQLTFRKPFPRRNFDHKILAPSYFDAYARWLSRTGEDGRASVQELSFEDERERFADFDVMAGYERFFGLLRECRNLTTLSISLTAEHIAASDLPAYYQYLLGRSTIPWKAIRAFAAFFSSERFPRLRSIAFIYTVSKRDFMAFSIIDADEMFHVIRKWSIALSRQLVVHCIETLMASMQGMVERASGAKVRVQRVPMICMTIDRWKYHHTTHDVYTRGYCGLKPWSGGQKPGDGRVDWDFDDDER